MLNASWSAQLSSRMVLLWMSGAVDFSQRTFSCFFFFLEAVSNTSVRAKNKPFSWNGCPLIWWYKSICVLDTQVIQGDKLVDIIKLWWTVTVCVAHTLFCSVLLFCSLQDARHCKTTHGDYCSCTSKPVGYWTTWRHYRLVILWGLHGLSITIWLFALLGSQLKHAQCFISLLFLVYYYLSLL